MKKRLPALLLALTMALALAACGGSQLQNPSDAPSAGADATAAPTEEPIDVDLTQSAPEFAAGLAPDTVMLTVNGDDITADLFLYLLINDCFNFESTYAAYGVSVSDFADMLLGDAVNMGTSYALLQQKAVELGVPLTDEQRAKIADTLDEDALSMLKGSYGFTDDSIEFISTTTDYYQNVLSTFPTPDDDTLNNYAYQVKHILLKTVDDDNNPLDDETIAQKKAQADDLLAQLRALEGEEQLNKFDELMNEYSEDPGLASNPDGYEYTVDDSLVDGFTETALALKPGEISDVLETTYGYHILLRGEVADLSEYADSYRQGQLDDQMETWVGEADVVKADPVDDLDVAAVYNRYMAYQQAYYEANMADSDGGDAGAVG